MRSPWTRMCSRGVIKRIARSLKRSAERSHARKAGTYRSAISMLTFYLNRGGSNLPAARKRTLERAKEELRSLYGRPSNAKPRQQRSLDRGRWQTRRHTRRRPCQKERPSSAPVATSSKERPPARRRESSSARRWTTSARASTAPVPPSKPSPSACPRRVGPASTCRPRRPGPSRRRRVERPPLTGAKGPRVLQRDGRRRSAAAPPRRLCAAKAVAPPRAPRSRARPAAPPPSEGPPAGRLPRRRPRAHARPAPPGGLTESRPRAARAPPDRPKWAASGRVPGGR